MAASVSTINGSAFCIAPQLMFEGAAEEALRTYLLVFPEFEVRMVVRCEEGEGR